MSSAVSVVLINAIKRNMQYCFVLCIISVDEHVIDSVISALYISDSVGQCWGRYLLTLTVLLVLKNAACEL